MNQPEVPRPATPALLCHLTEIGFDGAPRFIGIDAQRREVLSYIPGTAVTPPSRFERWRAYETSYTSLQRASLA